TRRLLRDGHTVDFGLQMDVTERRQTELRTERERERDRFAIESAGIGVWERGFNGRPSYWSPTMYRLRGLTPGDPRPLQALVALTALPADVEEADRRMARCIELGETYRHEFIVRWADGTERWIASTGRAVRDAGGQVVALAGVNVDVTERQLASALTRERDRAEQASAAKSGLMARVSHELRTPMNAVLGFAELMAQDALAPLEARQAERLAQIRSAGSHLLGLIDDLLELSRAEAGGRPMQLEPVVLDELLHEALQWVAGLARQHGVRVEARVEAEAAPGAGLDAAALPGVVMADRRRLGQVIVNLLTNGIKYNRSGGRVQVRAQAAELEGAPAWELCVSDDGRGLSNEQMGRLFEPFNRLGAEREGIPGTGIGLSIVQQLVQDMGGRLRVASEHGRGSEFRVSLRAAEGGAQAPAPSATATAPAADATVPPPQPLPLRVVYVEDNPVNEMLVREMLSLRPQVQLETAHDGRSGIARVLALRPDVVLLDLQLPDISGLEVLRLLRMEPALAGSSFVALSANAMPDDVRHALAQGFDDYWTKPLDLLRFLAAIDALALQHGRASLEAAEEVGEAMPLPQGASRSRSQVPPSSR
ncbi:MAG TPA: ATP-binding protein, partial [Ideonella sp.]|nr:ATP-binding protein [Ideonella sp.]